ncbi:hypothetical protein BAPKO_0476 [Borreliella afzelii PKo]|nr:hypothetical protein BAPKO_0476 [Borreliella afzelii PKo]
MRKNTLLNFQVIFLQKKLKIITQKLLQEKIINIIYQKV